MSTTRRNLTFSTLVLACLLLAGCATGVESRQRIHHSLIGAPDSKLPQRAVVIPVEITVKEMSAGGVTEKVDTWSKQASSNVENAIQSTLKQRGRLTVVPFPKLGTSDQTLVEQYRALYEQVATAAFIYGRQWQHKNERFDYTMGDGLKFLKEKTGADVAVFTIGEDVVTTGGRQAAAFFASLVGVGIQLGHSFLTMGVVSLETGDVLWYNYDVSYANLDMREPGDAKKMVENVAEGYDTLREKTKVTQAKQ